MCRWDITGNKKMKKFYFTLFMMFVLGCSVAVAQTKHTCPSCNGKGETVERCPNGCHNGAIYCTACNYSGTVQERCSNCSGGYVTKQVRKTCSYCGGKRQFRKESRQDCSCRNGKRPVSQNGQTVYVDCNRCNGRGYLSSYYNENCPTCNGSGYDGYTQTQERCSRCNGNGTISKTCTKCNGNRSYMCPRCNGYANVTVKCSRCKGYGEIYTD